MMTTDSLFDYILCVRLVPTGGGQSSALVEYRYPPRGHGGRASMVGGATDKFLDSITEFCFPDSHGGGQVKVAPEGEWFSFVLTADDGARRFGYCYRCQPSPGGDHAAELKNPACFCLLSYSPCYTVFTEVLKRVASLYDYASTGNPSLTAFLDGFKRIQLPEPGCAIAVPLPNSTETIEISRPDGNDSHLEYLNFQPLLQKLSADHLFRVVVAMLAERRVIFVSSSLAILSSCTQAAVALLYPFQWQHIFIPVLPPSLLYFCCAPMPFVVGVLSSFLPALQDLYDSMEDVFIVDLDADRFLRKSVNDAAALPRDLTDPVIAIIKSLQKKILFFRLKNYDAPVGELPPLEKRQRLLEAFLTFFVELLSNYRSFIVPTHEDGFDKAAFVAAAPAPFRDFLATLTGTQLFERFIIERVRKQLVQQQSPFDKRVTMYNSIAALCQTGAFDEGPSRFSRFERGLPTSNGKSAPVHSPPTRSATMSSLPVYSPPLSTSPPPPASPIPTPPPAPPPPPPPPPTPLRDLRGSAKTSTGSPSSPLRHGTVRLQRDAAPSSPRDRSQSMAFAAPPSATDGQRVCAVATFNVVRAGSFGSQPLSSSSSSSSSTMCLQQDAYKPRPNSDRFHPDTEQQQPRAVVRPPPLSVSLSPVHPASSLPSPPSSPSLASADQASPFRALPSPPPPHKPASRPAAAATAAAGAARPLPTPPSEKSSRARPEPVPRSTPRQARDVATVRHSSGPASLRAAATSSSASSSASSLPSTAAAPALSDYIKWLRQNNQTEFIPRIEDLQPEFHQLHFAVSQLNPVPFLSLFDLPVHPKTLKLFTVTQEFVFAHAKPAAPPRSKDRPAKKATPPPLLARDKVAGAHLSDLPQKQLVGVNIAAFERSIAAARRK